jgi:hypothetical protein
MRLVSVLLVLGFAASAVLSAPGGDEGDIPVGKQFKWPAGWFADRDTFPEQEPNEPCGNDQPVNCGDVVDPAYLDAVGYPDWYSVELNEGDELTTGTDESPGLPTFDSYMELYADDCVTQLAYDDDGGPGLYSLISGIIAPYTGTYHILVRSYGDHFVGGYMVFFDCGAPPPPPDNNTCAGAEEHGYFITRCTAGSLQGNTEDCHNDYSPTNDCTGYSARGNDAVYYMDLEEGDYLDMTYTQLVWDTSFYILTHCSDMNSCVVGADATFAGEPERFQYAVPAAGRYYLILDAYSADQGGDWTLDYAISCPAPPIGACCYEEQQCTELTEEECAAIGGYLWIDGEVCDPNPCPPVATKSSTWGRIKADYRE